MLGGGALRQSSGTQTTDEPNFVLKHHSGTALSYFPASLSPSLRVNGPESLVRRRWR